MKRFSKFLVFAALFLIAGSLSSLAKQSVRANKLSGRVIDAETGKPVYGVNIFLAHTMMGVASDRNGHFVIPRVPNGTFELVVSMIGYKVQKRELMVSQSQDALFFALKPTIIKGPEITVTAKDREKWRAHLKTFTSQLLGTSRNALQTKILNPYILDFFEKGGVLKAVTQEPLVIENRGLGYKIFYILEKFESRSDYVKYSGNPGFEELAPDSPEQRRIWRENRKKAYNGSLRHFLASICMNDKLAKEIREERVRIDSSDIVDRKAKEIYRGKNFIEKEGFRVLGIRYPFSKTIHPVRYTVNINDFLRSGNMPTEYYLTFPHILQVTFRKELEEKNYPAFRNENRNPAHQISRITLEADSVLIDAYGRYFDRFKIKTSGYWAWERLAEMLPYEFEWESIEVGTKH